MIVLVTGDRNWSDWLFLFRELDRLHAEHGITTVIEGGASGADGMASNWAVSRRVPFWEWPAHWNHDNCPERCSQAVGRAAGSIRNGVMLEAALRMLPCFPAEDLMVVAFHNDLANSKGTRNMVERARRRGVQTLVKSSTT